MLWQPLVWALLCITTSPDPQVMFAALSLQGLETGGRCNSRRRRGSHRLVTAAAAAALSRFTPRDENLTPFLAALCCNASLAAAWQCGMKDGNILAGSEVFSWSARPECWRLQRRAQRGVSCSRSAGRCHSIAPPALPHAAWEQQKLKSDAQQPSVGREGSALLTAALPSLHLAAGDPANPSALSLSAPLGSRPVSSGAQAAAA